jgi:hypothetical protein
LRLKLALWLEGKARGTGTLRKRLAVTIMASLGAALAACTDQPPSSVNSSSANSLAYERPAPVTRAPLAPPSGYGSSYAPPPPLGAPYASSSPPPAPYPNSAQHYADPQTAALGWQASPRWSAVEGDGCIEVKQGGRDGQMKIDRCAHQGSRRDQAQEGTLAPPDE